MIVMIIGNCSRGPERERGKMRGRERERGRESSSEQHSSIVEQQRARARHLSHLCTYNN